MPCRHKMSCGSHCRWAFREVGKRHYSTDFMTQPVELNQEGKVMSREKQQPRKPATKFANLRKKMAKQKVQVKQPKRK